MCYNSILIPNIDVRCAKSCSHDQLCAVTQSRSVQCVSTWLITRRPSATSRSALVLSCRLALTAVRLCPCVPRRLTLGTQCSGQFSFRPRPGCAEDSPSRLLRGLGPVCTFCRKQHSVALARNQTRSVQPVGQQ